MIGYVSVQVVGCGQVSFSYNRVVVSMRIPFRADALKIQVRDGTNIPSIGHYCIADNNNCVDCITRGLKKK